MLVTLSSSTFRGEEEREIGFRATLRELAPDRAIHEVTDTDGLDAPCSRPCASALAAAPASTRSTPSAAATRHPRRLPSRSDVRPTVFVAHDLDGDNRALLRTRQISAVLHHDLRADMRRACRLLMQAQGALPGSPVSVPSQIQVVTPYNEPPGLDLARVASRSRPARPAASAGPELVLGTPAPDLGAGEDERDDHRHHVLRLVEHLAHPAGQRPVRPVDVGPGDRRAGRGAGGPARSRRAAARRT